MIGCKSLLSDYVEKDGHVGTFEDNIKWRTKGFGPVQCKTMEFMDVSYVKGLIHNLISISQLCDAGYKVYFREKVGNMTYSENSILITSIRKNDIYVLDVFVASLTFNALYFQYFISLIS